MAPYLHGVEVVEIDGGARPIRPAPTSVIGLLGTAPQGPLNEPVLLRGSRRQAAEAFGSGFGTLPPALAGIFDQTGATVVAVNILDPLNHRTAAAAKTYTLVGDAVQLDHRRLTDVVVKNEGASTTYTLGDDYAVDLATGALKRNAGGRIAANAKLKVTYKWLDTSKITDAQVLAAAEALLQAEARLGVRPKILAAPGFSGAVTRAANKITGAPVAAGLAATADRLRAILVADGPNTTDADALAFRRSLGSRRVFVVDPAVRAAGAAAPEPASARVAGLLARTDEERGFWHSPSNRPLAGLSGTARPIDFAPGDAQARANLLNAGDVATVIRQASGFRLWGNRTCADDPKWAFLPVVRTADAIHDALLRAHLWAVDRALTRTYFAEVAESVNAYLRSLQTQGAILGGRCWRDPELNSAANLQNGQAYFDFDFTPAYPAERIVFRSHLTAAYLQELTP